MHIVDTTIDRIMRKVFEEFFKSTHVVNATRGNFKEICGCLIELKNPLARISRTESKGKPFSAIGEFLWYLSGTNSLEFIEYYISHYQNESEDGETIYGGYGPRLFNMRNNVNQIENVIALLTKKPTSRRAVIQIFNAEDIDEDHKEIPCTCTIQVLIRENKLNIIINMRSNDAFWGLPHDVFCFTLLQEYLAKRLSVDIGRYMHMVGSLHLYEDKFDKVNMFLREGLQQTISMPPMPKEDPYNSINVLLELEKTIRNYKDEGGLIHINIPNTLDIYWKDIAYLLIAFRLIKDKKYQQLEALKDRLSDTIYIAYLDDKLALARKQE